jgi:hypothetical protein
MNYDAILRAAGCIHNVARGFLWALDKEMVCLNCTTVLDRDVPILRDHDGHLVIMADVLKIES